MQVFNDPKYLFLHDQKLTFDWMEKYGLNIELVADDLVDLAVKFGFDNHEIDQKKKADMQKHLDQYEPLVAEVKQKMKSY
mmetsp:Transcript_65620/g.90772  ORF Transcript_65620/g.90772 Transcript_65620/m.90772 type:complete len:80 (-) Transcript_65620:287-526(-)